MHKPHPIAQSTIRFLWIAVVAVTGGFIAMVGGNGLQQTNDHLCELWRALPFLPPYEKCEFEQILVYLWLCAAFLGAGWLCLEIYRWIFTFKTRRNKLISLSVMTFFFVAGGIVSAFLLLSEYRQARTVIASPPTQEAVTHPNDLFNAEIRVALNSTGRSPLTLYMMQYPSSFGSTASPLPYLFYLQITNRQDFVSTVNSYKLEVLDDRNQWLPMQSIPIEEGIIYTLNSTAPAFRGIIQNPGAIRTPKGTYRLATSMQPSALQNAIRVNPTPILNLALQKPLSPHGSVEGWAAFDSIEGLADVPQRHFKITIKDSASATSTISTDNPLPGKETDTSIALIWVTGPTIDLSGAHIKFYSEPFPLPKENK